jgi:hypothetical protein
MVEITIPVANDQIRSLKAALIEVRDAQVDTLQAPHDSPAVAKATALWTFANMFVSQLRDHEVKLAMLEEAERMKRKAAKLARGKK